MVLLFSSTPWPSSNFLPMSGHWIEGYGLRKECGFCLGAVPHLVHAWGKQEAVPLGSTMDRLQVDVLRPVSSHGMSV